MITTKFLIRSAQLDATIANKSKYLKNISVQTNSMDSKSILPNGEKSEFQQPTNKDDVSEE
jgi:hypothetical protein